jgi:hypothetical protein
VGAVGTPRDKEVYRFCAAAAFHPIKHQTSNGHKYLFISTENSFLVVYINLTRMYR